MKDIKDIERLKSLLRELRCDIHGIPITGHARKEEIKGAEETLDKIWDLVCEEDPFTPGEVVVSEFYEVMVADAPPFEDGCFSGVVVKGVWNRRGDIKGAGHFSRAWDRSAFKRKGS